MRYYLLPLFLLASGCGMTIHSDPVKVEPIVVTGSISVDFAQVAQYCVNSCANKFPDDSVQQTQCTSDCYTEFFNILNVAVKK